MHYEYLAVLARFSNLNREHRVMTIGWQDPLRVKLDTHAVQVREESFMYGVLGVEAWNDHPHEYRVLFEVSWKGWERLVVDSHEPFHYLPDRYIFMRDVEKGWICHEEWSPNQVQHDPVVESVVRCGTHGLYAIIELLRPQVTQSKQLLAA